MSLMKIAVSLVLFSSLFLFSGCQGNNSDTLSSSSVPTQTVDTNTTNKITVVLPISSTVLTTNSEVVKIDIRAFDSANNPYSSGTIVKVNPSDVLTGRDIGTFDKTTSTLVNGVASFVYTAPANLAADVSNITFAFYHSSDPTNVKVYTMSIVPKVNQTVLTSYTLETSTTTDVQMNLQSSKTVSYTIYDANRNQLANDNVVSMKITSLNPSLGTLSDTSGNTGSSITINSKNNVTVNITSNTKSGIVPIKVEASFKDVNGKVQNLTEVFNVTILSGPPTAMSLSYAGTTQNASKAKFIENWVLTVTDKYNNLVNSNPSISMGMLAGYAKSSGTTANSAGYLYYPPSSGGTLSAGTPDKFTATSGVFSNVDQVNDILVLFGNGYTYNASGKWDINTNSASTLDLVDDYAGANTSGLGFAVGHNYRQDRCNEGSEWVANVYPQNNNYILDATGSMVLQVEYDYYLVGKSVMLWANLVGEHNGATVKIGEAKKVNLRGNGLSGESYTYAKGYTGTRRLYISVADTVEWYYNANFGYNVEVTGDGTSWSVTGTSMSNGITSCTASGRAYVDVTITASPDSGGTITLSNVLPANEF